VTTLCAMGGVVTCSARLARWFRLFCFATLLSPLVGCSPRLSGVYEADYHEMMSQKIDAMGQAINPMLQSLPETTRRNMELQQKAIVDQTASQLAQSMPTRLAFSNRKVVCSSSGVEVTSPYTVDADSVLIGPVGGPVSYRLTKRSDNTLAFNGIVFRPIAGSAPASSTAAVTWVGGILILGGSAFAGVWLLQRRRAQASAGASCVHSTTPERLALERLGVGRGASLGGKNDHKITRDSVAQPTSPVFEDDSRFMPPEMRQQPQDTRFMPPESRPGENRKVGN